MTLLVTKLNSKEQEFNTLQKNYGTLHDQSGEVLRDNTTLLTENIKLKEEIKQLNSYCKHYVVGECSQSHHENCNGMVQCIYDLEQKITKSISFINNVIKETEYLSQRKHLLSMELYTQATKLLKELKCSD